MKFIKLTGPQIKAYQDWEQRAAPTMASRYAFRNKDRPIFSVYDQDVLTRLDGYDVLSLRSCLPEPRGDLELSEIETWLSLFDGQRTVGDVHSETGDRLSLQALKHLATSLLGTALDGRAIIQMLDRQIARGSIVRLPLQNPYLVPREYWSNNIDCRAYLPDLLEATTALPTFKTALSQMHILATMGQSLDSFYGGVGNVPTIPGVYRMHPVGTGLLKPRANFIDAYLVRMGLSGLKRTQRRLYSDAGTSIGHTVDDDPNYLVMVHRRPERGLLDAILDEARAALHQAVLLIESEACHAQMIEALSRFHKLFLHAHPFYNINNSIAMNIINGCLEEAGIGSLPHLMLDYMALWIEFNEYAEVLKRSVVDYAFRASEQLDQGEIAERLKAYYLELRQYQATEP